MSTSNDQKVSGGADYTREHSQKLREAARLADVPKHKLQKGMGFPIPIMHLILH
jgi:hypothetical protein